LIVNPGLTSHSGVCASVPDTYFGSSLECGGEDRLIDVTS